MVWNEDVEVNSNCGAYYPKQFSLVFNRAKSVVVKKLNIWKIKIILTAIKSKKIT